MAKFLLDMNTALKTKAKNGFEKDDELFSVWKDYGKCKEAQSHQRHRLVAEPNHHTTKWFSEKLLTV